MKQYKLYNIYKNMTDAKGTTLIIPPTKKLYD